jgi:steroid delta-isomerase
VERFNEGVRSGDFGPMLEQFAEGAELAFEGVPLGPFRGKPAIVQAYVDRPPDDEIVILRTRESGEDLVVADYAWKTEPGARAGTLILRLRDAEIDRLLVTFG